MTIQLSPSLILLRVVSGGNREKAIADIDTLIRDAVSAEREACAKIADNWAEPSGPVPGRDGICQEAQRIAQEIRSRR